MNTYSKYIDIGKLTMLSLALSLFLTSCKKDKIVLHENITRFSKFPKEDNISFKELYEYNKGIPGSLFLVDSTLIIFEISHDTESFFYNYSLKNRQLSKGYLNVGRGPSEAIGAHCAGISGNRLLAYDVTLDKILMTDVETAIKTINPSFQTFNLKKGTHNQITFLGGNRFLANGSRDSKYKIQEVDFSGKVLNEFGEYKHIPKNMILSVVKESTCSNLSLKPTKDKVAVSYFNTDILEIYDLKKPYKSIAIQGPESFDLDFEVRMGVKYEYSQSTKESKRAFLEGTVTDKYIYLLYSGLNFDKTNTDSWSRTKFIYVYDWNGNPVRKLNLDRSISGLAVSKDDKTIYSFDYDKGFLIEAKIN